MAINDRWAMTAAAALALFSTTPSASAADAGAPWVEEEFVTPTMCTSSFALTTDLLLVGAPCWETSGRQRQGALLEFRRDLTQNRWSYVSAPVVASDGQTGSELGTKVLLDGDTAVVGAPAFGYFNIPAGQGAAYVFARTAGGWTETQKLTAPDGHAGDRFGQHAALSGDTVAISAFHGPMEAGPGRIYVYVRSGGRFKHVQTLETDNTVYPFFGNTLALEGDTLLVGMADVRGPMPRPPRSVLIFRRASASARFERVQEIIPADPSTSGAFGAAVALQGDHLLVGAPGAYEEHGAVFDFRGTSGGFVEHAHFIPQQVFQRDGVGCALAIDGDMALVGALNYTTASDSYYGAVTVWTLSGDEWVQETMFRPSGSFAGFGQDLALAGSLAVVSAGGIIHAFHRAAPRSTDAGAAGGTSGAGGTSNSGGSGNASGSAGVDGGSAAASGASGAAGATGSNAQPRPAEEDSGCGCRIASGHDSRTVGWIAMLVALLVRRRIKAWAR